MSKPKIILAMPHHVGLIDIVSKNLNFHGFDVIAFNQMISPKPLTYPNFGYRLYKAYRKVFLKDMDYKNKLRNPDNIEFIKKRLEKWDGYADYTLVIRPDMFTSEVLEYMKSRTKMNFVGYQWDGLHRFPGIFDRVGLFDRFFVFDPKDLYANLDIPLLSITNFCVDYFPLIQNSRKNNHQMIAYFIGYHMESRVNAIEDIVNVLLRSGVSVDFSINHAPKFSYGNLPIKRIKELVSFEENLSNVKAADILIDLVINTHNGLSFRVFEALYFKKKLITNNEEVCKYDFYHPDNILIWKNQSVSELKVFIEKPYNSAVDDICKKYFFGNWIKNVLDIEPYTPIDLSNIR